MSRRTPVVLSMLVALAGATAQAASGPVPAPKIDAPLAASRTLQTVVLAGGCFWGIQAVFQHVHGVTQAVSGYAGGSASTAQYETVSTGRTGHAESVQLTYDASAITLGQLLRVFFSVAHDPTELNRQGPDEGTQYRSVIFYQNGDQQRVAEAYIAQLDQAKVFGQPIVTQVVALKGFYPAEAYHQDYASHHPDDPYIRINDAPKVSNLQRAFPDLYVSKPGKD
jgi:peptide-methionine (S)-S-oxide reductase